jgi:hypothetical protein
MIYGCRVSSLKYAAIFRFLNSFLLENEWLAVFIDVEHAVLSLATLSGGMVRIGLLFTLVVPFFLFLIFKFFCSLYPRFVLVVLLFPVPYDSTPTEVLRVFLYKLNAFLDNSSLFASF